MCILGPEEILKLAHILHREEVGFKQAAGDDIVLWKQPKCTVKKKEEPASKTEAKVLHFNRPTPQIEEKQEVEETNPDDVRILSSDVILLQREISKETNLETHKAGARSGYQKATEMYVVKSQSLDGKEKIRFASTNGVLINKKQA